MNTSFLARRLRYEPTRIVSLRRRWAALPTHDALDHHGRDAREHRLGHRG
jgi:hypothetical protein